MTDERTEIKFEFTIPGTPRAKVRKTRNQSWLPEVQRYAKYKDAIRHAFIASLGSKSQPYTRAWIADGKPLSVPLSCKIWMDVQIIFTNEVHPDPEGIFGAIADALFTNDKHCAGSFDFIHDREADPKVDVQIRILPETT